MKLTRGAVPLDGTMALSPSFDTLGAFTRTAPRPRPAARRLGRRRPTPRPAPPRLVPDAALGLVEPLSPRLDDMARRLTAAGAEIVPFDLPAGFDAMREIHRAIFTVEALGTLADEWTNHRPLVSPKLRDLLAEAETRPPGELVAAQQQAAELRRRFDDLTDGLDAVLAPSSPGEAPRGLDYTGDPSLNGMWTLLHGPLVHVPDARVPGRMPLGIQLVGRRGDDRRLVALAGWIEGAFAAGTAAGISPRLRCRSPRIERDVNTHQPAVAETGMANLVGSAVDDADRLAAVRRAGLLADLPSPAFDRLTRLATRLLGVPVSLMTLVDADRQVFVGQHGLSQPWAGTRETPLTHSFCRQVVETGRPLVIDDARTDERVKGNPAIAALGVIGYCAVPLASQEGQVLGAFCVIEHRPRHWNASDLGTLVDLAAAAMSEIGHRWELSRRRETEERLQILVSEIDHRVKNSLRTRSLLEMQARADDAYVREQLEEAAARSRPSLVHDRLYGHEATGIVRLDDYLQRLCGDLAGSLDRPQAGARRRSRSSATASRWA
jgi:two-component sensor histidine kinase